MCNKLKKNQIFCLFLASVFMLLTCGCKSNNIEYSSDDVIYEYIYQTDDTESNTSYVSSIKDSKKNSTSSKNDTSSKNNTSKNNTSSSVKLSDEEIAAYTPTSITLTLYDAKTNTYGITWNTKSQPYESVVQVCEGSAFNEKQAKEIKARVQQYSTYNLGDAAYAYYVSKAEITLDPNKTYTYRAVDKTLKISSKTAVISTKSSNVQKFTFVHVSDSQVEPSEKTNPSRTGDDFGQTLSAIKKSCTEFSFLLHTGDVVEWSKYEDYWKAMLDFNSQYLMSIPVMAISGNHETTYRNGSNETFKHFNYNIPNQEDTTKGFYYTFDYGYAKFIMLNTNRLSNNQLTQDQYDWLVNTLKSNTQKWTIVAMHNALYSVSMHGSDPEHNSIALSLQEQLSEIFAQYKVDLVLQGHDHAYSKTYPITYAGVIDKTHSKETINGIDYDVNPRGTIYVMNGPAGNQSRTPNAKVNRDLYEWYSRGLTNSWAEITIDNNTLTVIVKNETDGVASIQKQYGIKK